MKLKLNEDFKTLELVECTDQELSLLKLLLNVQHAGYNFLPQHIKRNWNGYVNFLNSGKYIQFGLWEEIVLLCKSINTSCEIENFEKMFLFDEIKFEDFNKWVQENFTGDFKPHDYQIEAAYKILIVKRSINELATAAGKTLITFLVVAYLHTLDKSTKFLLVVPSTSLVEQTISAFMEYNNFLETKLNLKYQEICGGMKPRSDIKNCNVFVATYQSLAQKENRFFDSSTKEKFMSQFTIVGVDECHTGKSISVQDILKICSADRRFGLTGTVPKSELDRFTILSQLGPLITKITAKYLMDLEHISSAIIKILKIRWGDNETLSNLHDLLSTPGIDGAKVLNVEKQAIIASKQRLQFICDLVGNLKTNTLILFQHIEYGDILREAIKKNCKHKSVYYVDGSTNTDLREDHKADMESGNDKILVASFGTFSTGISVNNIHNIVFCESYKSDIIIRQSIGRGLRKHKDKAILTVYDIVDDLSVGGVDNKILKQGRERVKIYKEQKFKFDYTSLDLATKYPIIKD